MAVFLLILKIIGCILLSIVAVVILALFVKVRITADYAQQASVVVQWLFLKFPVFPMKKKEKKATEKEEEIPQPAALPTPEAAAPSEPAPTEAVGEEPSTPAQPTQDTAEQTDSQPQQKKESGKPNILQIFYDSNGGVEGIILLVKELFSYIGSFFGGLLHAFVVDELMIDMTVTKSDAAQTAIYYGQLCSTLYPMLGALVTKYRIRQYDVSISPDYIAKKNTAEMHISFWFRPATLIGCVLLLVGRLVFKFACRIGLRMVKPLMKARKNENNK